MVETASPGPINDKLQGLGNTCRLPTTNPASVFAAVKAHAHAGPTGICLPKAWAGSRLAPGTGDGANHVAMVSPPGPLVGVPKHKWLDVTKRDFGNDASPARGMHA